MNPDGNEIASSYWRDAVYRPAETLLKNVEGRMLREGTSAEPLKFKAYRGLPRWPLPSPALSLPYPAPPSRADSLDLTLLSTLLYYAYGVNRHDLQSEGWPYHRVVPSARCFFPTELYIALPEEAAPPGAGIFYYDPMHHALVRVREGVHGSRLGATVGADLSEARGVVLLTSLFWKNAFRYRDYSYRLCTQEAGIVASSVLLVSRALGMDGHAHFHFLDEVLNRLLALQPAEESAMLVLPLYRGGTPGGVRALAARSADQSGALLEGLPEVTHPFLQPSIYTPDAVPLLTAISQASFTTTLESNSSRLLTSTETHPAPSQSKALPIEEPGAEQYDLAEVLRTRDSGPVFMDFEPTAAPPEVVWNIARAVTRPCVTDIVASDAPLPCECYLLVRSVVGISEGTYRVRSDGNALEQISAGPVTADLLAISATSASGLVTSNVNFAEGALTAFLVTPREAAMDRFGARSFRILSQAAGFAAHAIFVASARCGLSARTHNGYSSEIAEQRLGISGTGRSVLFQIVIGFSRPGSALRLPVAF